MILKIRLPVILLLTAAVFLYGCNTYGSVPSDEAAAAWYNLGNAYTELGRHSDAVKAYTKARKLNPGLLGAGFNLARVHIILKQYDEGMHQLELLLESDPENRNVLETIAWVYHLQGDNEAALKIYNRVLADFSASRNSLYNSALILSEIEEYSEALSRFKHLYELYPEEDSVVFEIAFLEASLENPEEALVWLDKRLATVPGDIAALELAGDMYVQRMSYGEALASYRKVIPLSEPKAASVAEQEESGLSTEVVGRVSFKIGEILLLYIEDVEGGLEALQRSRDAGWSNQDDFIRILEYTEADWFDAASKILEINEPSTDTEDSVPVDGLVP